MISGQSTWHLSRGQNPSKPSRREAQKLPGRQADVVNAALIESRSADAGQPLVEFVLVGRLPAIPSRFAADSVSSPCDVFPSPPARIPLRIGSPFEAAQPAQGQQQSPVRP